MKASITGARLDRKQRGLSLEAEDAAVNVGSARDHARIVDRIPCRKVVAAVDDDIVAGDEVDGVSRRQRMPVRLDANVGIDGMQARFRRFQFRPPDVGGGMEDLALQVGEVDGIEIYQAQSADPGGREIHRRGRSQTTGADAKHSRRLETLLPSRSNLRQQDVAAIAKQLLARQLV